MASTAGPVGRRLVVSRNVAIETAGPDGVVVYRVDTGARLRLVPPVYALMQRFATPAVVAEAAGHAEPAGRWVVELERRGFLVAADGEPADVMERPATLPGPYTLFNAPRHRSGDRPARIAVVGIPSDLGEGDVPGARGGPSAIRRRSYEFPYRCRFRTGRPMGWFDVERRRRVLEGVTLADHGDVWHHPGEGSRDVLVRAAGACEAVLRDGSFPVLLGGDHSVALAPARVLARRGPLNVVWLDADGDLGPLPAGARVDHRSAARRILELPGVEQVACIGVRRAPAGAPPGVTAVTVAELRARGDEALRDVFPADVPCLVAVDVNVLDPAYAPGVAAPVPGGLRLDEVCALLTTLSDRCRVAALAVCGTNPDLDPGPCTPLAACHVLLAGMAAFVEAHEPGPPAWAGRAARVPSQPGNGDGT